VRYFAASAFEIARFLEAAVQITMGGSKRWGVRRVVFFLVLAAWACGEGLGATPWVGHWTLENPADGEGMGMTLSGTGTEIKGSGSKDTDPAGIIFEFTVSGTSNPVSGFNFTLTYLPNAVSVESSTVGYTYSQPDMNHLVLARPSEMLHFARR